MSRINFRDTGYKRPVKTAVRFAGADAVVVEAPGTGKQIVLYDVMVVGSDPTAAGGQQALTQGSGGTIMMYPPEGHTGFVAPFPFGENKSVWAKRTGLHTDKTYTVTVTYSIEDV